MRVVLLPLMALILSACANGGGPSSLQFAPTPSAERGLAVAQQRCAGCHDIAGGRGTSKAGPGFAEIRLRYNSLSLERRLVAVRADGHYEMPRLSLEPTEIQDLVDYIEALDR